MNSITELDIDEIEQVDGGCLPLLGIVVLVAIILDDCK